MCVCQCRCMSSHRIIPHKLTTDSRNKQVGLITAYATMKEVSFFWGEFNNITHHQAALIHNNCKTDEVRKSGALQYLLGLTANGLIHF